MVNNVYRSYKNKNRKDNIIENYEESSTTVSSSVVCNCNMWKLYAAGAVVTAIFLIIILLYMSMGTRSRRDASALTAYKGMSKGLHNIRQGARRVDRNLQQRQQIVLDRQTGQPMVGHPM